MSDVVAATATAGGTYLSLRLSTTRSQVLDLERHRIALDEQLRLAAKIQRNLLPAQVVSTAEDLQRIDEVAPARSRCRRALTNLSQ